MPKAKSFTDSRQLELFADWEECCPLCGAAGTLTTCRRLYTTQRACLRYADALKGCGWVIVQ
jgi:hypothetical protein